MQSNEDIEPAMNELSEQVDELELIQYQIENYIALIKLNDWGRIQIYKKIGTVIFGDANKAILYTWFSLIFSSFDVRMAFIKEELFLAIQSDIKLFWTKKFIVNNKEYALLYLTPEQYQNGNESYLVSYEKETPNTYKKINFLSRYFPEIGNDYVSKEVDFKLVNENMIHSNNYSFAIKSNKNYVEMYKDLPVLDYHAFFRMPMSNVAFESIKKGLKPFLTGKNTLEKTNILLNFVQFAFKYQFDVEQFGYPERPLAPEQTAYYIRSDCEDHSALFAFLVRKILGLDVALLLYEGHAATAVNFKEKVDGYTLSGEYSDFVICDPTYTGAHCGSSMPQYIGETPEVYIIEADQ